MARTPSVLWRYRLAAGLLSLVCCCLPSLAALATAAEPEATPVPQPTRDPSAEQYDSDNPGILSPDMLVASSAILIESTTGNVVFEKNADTPMYPASTTKILTALCALQFGDPSATTTISDNAANPPDGSSTIPVSAGEVVNVRDLIYGMMMKSGNDGAVALAECISGSEQAFAQTMNEVAAYLGCSNTHFTNASGYMDPGHYTTARDLAIIARAAMDVPAFRELAATYEYTMPATNMHPARKLVSGNAMLRKDPENKYYSADTIGIKTGFHSDAMNCFVGAFFRNGVELISVVLYTSESGRWTDSRMMMEYGFKQYVSTDPIAMYEQNPRILNVAGFDRSDTELGRLTLGIRVKEEYAQRRVYVVGTKAEIDNLAEDFGQLSHVNWTRENRAPVTAGEVMGILTFYPNNQEPVEYELYATRSIIARQDAPPSLAEIEAYTLADENPLPRFSAEYVVFPSILLLGLVLLLRFVYKRTASKRARRKRVPLPKNRHYR